MVIIGSTKDLVVELIQVQHTADLHCAPKLFFDMHFILSIVSGILSTQIDNFLCLFFQECERETFQKKAMRLKILILR